MNYEDRNIVSHISITIYTTKNILLSKNFHNKKKTSTITISYHNTQFSFMYIVHNTLLFSSLCLSFSHLSTIRLLIYIFSNIIDFNSSQKTEWSMVTRCFMRRLQYDIKWIWLTKIDYFFSWYFESSPWNKQQNTIK